MKIFASSLAKKILGVVIILGCSNIMFNGYVGIAEIHAQTSNTQTSNGGTMGPPTATEYLASIDNNAGSPSSTMGLWEILNLILKLIYLLLRPLLVVAGIALDNTLVYASVFHLDAPLWKFWNMIKTFANFTLGFMVLFAIIKNLFVSKDDKGPIDVIKKTLIAGILIQASWFIMAALVDVSTIATYAVGGLPLSVLKNTDIGQQKILKVNSEIDLSKFSALDKKGAGYNVWYSTVYSGKTINMSPCRIKGNFIVGREFGDPKYNNYTNFANTPYAGNEVCVLFGNQLVMWNESAFMSGPNSILQTNLGITGDYNEEYGYNTLLDTLVRLSGRENKSWVTGNLLNFKGGNTQPGFVSGSNFFGASTSITISELINKSKGFVGPLVTMYSSLLNFAQLTDTNVTSISETSGIFLIKTGVAIALFFPLLALAMVLIARVALLWLYIAGSPFLILKKVFENLIPKEALGKMDKHLELGNVLKLIFAPVVTVAALSISLIFMTALITGLKPDINRQLSSDVAENLQIQPVPAQNTGNQAYQIGSNSVLEFKNFDRGGSLDRFSWLIVNFFAIGILWTILFAAIKANALGESIGQKVQDFGSNVFQTLPILPFGPPGKDGRRESVGFGSAFNVLKDRPQQWADERKANDVEKVEELFKQPEVVKSIDNADFITSTATAKTIKEGVMKKGIREDKVVEAINATTSVNAIYTARSKITNSTEKANVEQEIIGSGMEQTTWDKAKAFGQAKTNLNEIITNSSPRDQSSVEAIFTNPGNSTAIEAYFTASQGAAFETKEIGGTVYTVTQKSGTTPGSFTYEVTKK